MSLIGRVAGCVLLSLLTGCAIIEPPTVSPQTVHFDDVTQAAGLAEAGSQRCAWGDFDNDGDADVMIGSKLYRNQGDGTFVRVSGDKVPAGPGVWGDFDNDGWLDYYVFGGKGQLWRNVAGYAFEAAAMPENPHARSMAAAWGDINNDGWLDLYVCNYEDWHNDQGTRPFPDLLYIADGRGGFREPWQTPLDQTWCARGANFADFDEDGDLDVYVSNYRLMPNLLWLNDGTGKLTDVAQERRVQGRPAGMGFVRPSPWVPAHPVYGHTIGSCWGDLDGDTDLDLVVVNFSHPVVGQDAPMVLLNSGRPYYRFTDVSASRSTGIYWQESYAKGALGDYDNDGDLDLYMTCVYAGDHGELYRNEGKGQFLPVGARKKVYIEKSYQVAWADYDGDGDLDLLTGGKLFRNRGTNRRWLEVTVKGKGSGIGARVVVKAGSKKQVREICGGNSGNQDPLTAHFGLGDCRDQVEVEVFYLSGLWQRQTVATNRTVVFDEAQATETRHR